MKRGGANKVGFSCNDECYLKKIRNKSKEVEDDGQGPFFYGSWEDPAEDRI